MNAPDFVNCSKCGGTMVQASPKNTSPLIMECRRCGHREWAEIHLSPPWPPYEGTEKQVRVVVDRTEGLARWDEIRALRKLSQELGSLSMDEAAKRIGSSKTIDLGVYRLNEAEELLKRAAEWGLSARLESPEERPLVGQEKRRFFEPFGAPVSAGEPGEDAAVIPVVWIVVGGVVILALVAWNLW